MALAGLILHASRCGSTLLLSALGTWPGVVVVNEPNELDVALTQARTGGGLDPVAAVLCQLAQRGERVIVKTDAWHALELSRLLAVAPAVPWLFMYRDPAEILVSHARQPGKHTVPGVLPPVWFGEPRTHHVLPHAASVLSSIFVAVTPHVDRSTLLDHAELPQAISEQVARHFGLDPTDVDVAALQEVLARDAKRPYLPYEDDRTAKQAAVTPQIAELASGRVGAAYRELVRRRYEAAA